MELILPITRATKEDAQEILDLQQTANATYIYMKNWAINALAWKRCQKS